MSTPMPIPPADDPFSHRLVESTVPGDSDRFGGFTVSFAFREPPPPIIDKIVDPEMDDETVERIVARLRR